MGTIHKLKPEVRDFIIESKKSSPALSCRKLTSLIFERFNIKVSKSSINIVIKEQGLSAPIGRTPKKKKRNIPMPSLPILIEESSKEVLVREEEYKEGKESIAKEAQDEARKKEELRVKEEERARVAAEEEANKRRLEEENRAEAKRREEEALKKAEEERRLKEEEDKKSEELKRLKEEAERKEKEEAAAKEAKEAARIAEESQKKEEEEKLRAAEEEALRKKLEDEKVKVEEIKKAQEEALRKAAEEIKKKEEESIAVARETERRVQEERLRERAVEEIRKAEEARAAAELKRKEEEGLTSAGISLKEKISDKIEGSGIVLLKAVDAIVGASSLICESVRSRALINNSELNYLIEGLIYFPLLEDRLEKPVANKLLAFLEELQNVKVLNLDIAGIISNAFTHVRCIKFSFSDGLTIYLDGQMYSAWTSAHVPYDFSSAFFGTKKQMDNIFNRSADLIIFNAPGYDMPSEDFIDFLLALQAGNRKINNLTFYGNSLEELEIFPVSKSSKHAIIFGVWPWQFVGSRRVRNIGNFRSFVIEEQEKEIYVADIEMEIANTNSGKQVSLRGAAIKENPDDKTKLVILSNFPAGAKSAEEIAAAYLKRWPNIEESFQDFSRKIELFTYTANAQHFFSLKDPRYEIKSTLGVKELLSGYLRVLDAYFRWCYLPSEYESFDLAEMQKRLYCLSPQISRVKEKRSIVKFDLPLGYAFAKDLNYACRRINERAFFAPEGFLSYLKSP